MLDEQPRRVGAVLPDRGLPRPAVHRDDLPHPGGIGPVDPHHGGDLLPGWIGRDYLTGLLVRGYPRQQLSAQRGRRARRQAHKPRYISISYNARMDYLLAALIFVFIVAVLVVLWKREHPKKD